MDPIISLPHIRVFSLPGHGDFAVFVQEVLGWAQDESIIKLCSIIGDCAKSVIVEDNYVDKDYKSMLSAHYSKIFAPTDKTVVRLLLFNSDIRFSHDLNEIDTRHQEHFIGYLTCYYVGYEIIGRTLLDPNKLGHNHRLCSTDFTCYFLGSRLNVRGFPYIQQDTNVMACAQASIWMMMRYMSTRYHEYKEFYPADILNADTDFSRGRHIPSSGLTLHQMSNVMTHLGFYPIVRIIEAGKEDIFHESLYKYVESGIPIVVGMNSRQHAIVLLGHTNEYDVNISEPDIQAVLAKKGYIPSYYFLKAYVCHNDAWLPYEIIPKQKYSSGPKMYQVAGCSFKYDEMKVEDISVMVVPLYEKIFLEGSPVENKAWTILNDNYLGIVPTLDKASIKYKIDGPLILRTYLTSSRAYKEFKKRKGTDVVASIYRQTSMSKFIWIVEFTVEKLYNSKDPKIFGEILFDATASQHEPANLCIHYPGYLYVNRREEHLKNNRLVDGIDLRTIGNVNFEYSMFVHNLGD